MAAASFEWLRSARAGRCPPTSWNRADRSIRVPADRADGDSTRASSDLRGDQETRARAVVYWEGSPSHDTDSSALRCFEVLSAQGDEPRFGGRRRQEPAWPSRKPHPMHTTERRSEPYAGEAAPPRVALASSSRPAVRSASLARSSSDEHALHRALAHTKTSLRVLSL